MSKNPTHEPGQREEEHKQAADARHEYIAKQVIIALGARPDLCLAQVKPLWGDRYRVNVLTSHDPICARIALSYFLQVDHDGNIVSASPAMLPGSVSLLAETRKLAGRG